MSKEKVAARVTTEGNGKTRIARILVQGKEVQFTDYTKYKRAADVICMIVGRPVSPHIKAEYSDQGRQELAAKIVAMLKDAKIDPEKTEDKALLFTYKALGGGIRLHDLPKKSKKVQVEDEDSGDVEDDEDEKDEDEKDEDESKDE